MALRTWLSLSETWNAANFGGTLPVTGDIVIIPRNARIAPMIGLDQSGGAGVVLLALVWQRGCKVGAGGPGNLLKIGATKLYAFGDAPVYHYNSGSLATQTFVDSPNDQLAYWGSGNQSQFIAVRRGRVVLARSHVWVHTHVAPGNPAVVRIEPGTAASELIMDGGTVQNYGNSFSATMRAGTLEQMSGYGLSALHMMGGLCYYDTTTALTSGYIVGGVLNLSRVPMSRTVTAIEAASRKNLIFDGSTTFTAAPVYLDEEALESVA